MEFSILHLSDLHITNKNGTYTEVLENLINDIEEQCEYVQNIILVITGDIIDKAQYTKENRKVVIDFFESIQKTIGKKIIGVEIVPGNHDKEQDEINKKIVEPYREAQEVLTISKKDWNYYLISYKSYLELVNQIRNIFMDKSELVDNSYYVDVVDKDNVKIIFINMDTSWSAFGGSEDRKKLCVDERQLQELKEQYQKEKRDANKKYITIINAHHPINWLKENDEKFLSSWLLNSEYFNIDFYLCGHTHDRQIKSLFDSYKSYITFVTGIGWDEKTATEEKDKHRYSIYNFDINSNSCEIVIRKTCADGSFDYDNDILLTEEEKIDKKIYLPIKFLENNSKIKIPVYMYDTLKNKYLFVDKNILDTISRISTVFYETARHMSLFEAMHVRDFFIKYQLNKPSKGTKIKEEIYDDYFYKSIESDLVNELFNNIKNYSIIYDNFLAYLREFCGTLVNELKAEFNEVEYIRLHFRKYYKAEDDKHLYIAFCQANAESDSPPQIRDLTYEKSMVQIAFENDISFVFTHNKNYNPLSMKNNVYEDFITMAPRKSWNTFSVKKKRKDVLRPYITSSLSIKCKNNSNFLDILNYLKIDDFIFKIVYEYVNLFKIDMKNFIQREDL